jgi:MtN3 and saliva related transmembrane protein
VNETTLGLVAAGWGVIMALSPIMQIRRMVHLGSSRDVSIGYLLVIVIGFAFWIAYGIAIRNPALVVPNTLAFIVGVGTIAVALHLRKTARRIDARRSSLAEVTPVSWA